jgi:hypothetical protein
MIRKTIFITWIIFTLFPSSSVGQTADFDDLDGHSGFWVGFGLGGNYFGVTKSMNVTFAREQHLFIVRYAKSDEVQFNVEGQYDKPTMGIKEFALMYGRYFKKDNFALTFSAGLSYLQGVYRGSNIQFRDYKALHISTIGIPLGFEFMVGLSDNVGIGVHCTGNLNTEKIFGGVNAKINVGLF